MAATKPRILVITLSNIGDLVMTTPVLEALHRAYPHHAVDVIADRRSSALLEPCPYIAALIHKDKRAGLPGVKSLLMRLRREHYDLAVDLRRSMLTLLIKCRRRATKKPALAAGPHAVEEHFTALRGILDDGATMPAPRLWLDPPARAAAARLVGDGSSARRLIVAPGANWPGKIWGIEKYRAVIAALREELDDVVVLGSANDRALARALCDNAPVKLIDLTGQTSLLVAAACMDNSAAFLGNDSGLGHMAAALQVPTVTVFGPGMPHRYRPWGPRAAIVLAPGGDLAALSSDAVIPVLRAQLKESR